MNKRRLESLIRVIKRVPKKRFDMERYVRKTTCGTFACAAGHFALSPEGKRLGLEIVGTTPVIKEKTGVFLYGLCAFAEVFDISYMDADYLFSPGRYDTEYLINGPIPKERVISRIRNFIKFPNRKD